MMCLHRYFTQHASSKQVRQSTDVDSDADSVGDDEFEEFLGA